MLSVLVVIVVNSAALPSANASAITDLELVLSVLVVVVVNSAALPSANAELLLQTLNWC